MIQNEYLERRRVFLTRVGYFKGVEYALSFDISC